MKSFERIFLYSVLALLVCYVFLVDGNVESKEIIQEEIRARRIVIVNDAGQEVVELSINVENNGLIVIYNKSGNIVSCMLGDVDGGLMSVFNKDRETVTMMGINGEGGGMMSVCNKDGNTDVVVRSTEYGGMMAVINKNGKVVAGMTANEKDNGEIGIWNKSGKRIGSLP